MSILVDKNPKVICQGITGSNLVGWAKRSVPTCAFTTIAPRGHDAVRAFAHSTGSA